MTLFRKKKPSIEHELADVQRKTETNARELAVVKNRQTDVERRLAILQKAYDVQTRTSK